MRPWKVTRFVPACPPANKSVPTETLRRHAGLPWLRRDGARHLWCTRRPATERVKVSVSLAAVFSVNENVVPTGARRRCRASEASFEPSRHLVCDCFSPMIFGDGGIVVDGLATTWTVTVEVAV